MGEATKGKYIEQEIFDDRNPCPYEQVRWQKFVIGRGTNRRLGKEFSVYLDDTEKNFVKAWIRSISHALVPVYF